MNLTVEDLGTILGVWAHPDDEAYLSAGLMAAARTTGHRVVVATATAGERGSPDPARWPPERLAAARRRELADSLAVVGVQEHHWLGFADGECGGVSLADGMAAVRRLIDDVRPDTIVTFGPDGMTGHPDHVAVSEWTTAAWRASSTPARLLHATLTPAFHRRWRQLNEQAGLWPSGQGPSTPARDLALLVRLDQAASERKTQALRAHTSQTAGLINQVGAETFRQWWADEAFVQQIR